MKQGVWTTGAAWGVTGAKYERFSEHLADALAHCIQRLVPLSGEKVLDVATGTGWTARLAAARGSVVTGADYSDALIEAARQLSKQRGMDITFEVADAHRLPYPDGSFDAVVSTFGVIFASSPEKVASELARVCRPGGRLGLAVWARDCTLATMAREVFAKFSPPPSQPPPPSPYAWGSEARLVELLGANFEMRFEEGTTVLREPDGEAVWRLWSETHGLTVTRLQALDAKSQGEFRQAFIEFHQRYRGPLGIAMPRDYLIAVGIRRSSNNSG